MRPPTGVVRAIVSGVLLLVFALGCGSEDPCEGVGRQTQGLSVALYPDLVFDPPALSLAPATATSTPTQSLLRNVGEGVAALLPLEATDARVEVWMDGVGQTLAPGAARVVHLRFVAPVDASLDGAVWARTGAADACGRPLEAELRLTSPSN